MRKSLQSILFLVALASLLSAAYTQRVLAQSAMPADIIPSDVTICKGEPLMVAFMATNPTTQTVKIPLDPRSFQYRIIPTKGEDNNLSFIVRSQGSSRLPPRRFAPGETAYTLLALPFFMHVAEGRIGETLSWRDIDFPPGEYTVLCRLYLDDVEPAHTHFEARLHVTVLPRDEKRLQQKYRELAQIVEDYRARELSLGSSSGIAPRLLLCEVRDPSAVPIISELLENDNPTVRLHAINALRHIPTPECLEALEKYEQSRKLSPLNDWYASKIIQGMRQQVQAHPQPE